MPQISIIVPVYNVEKYLHQCVDSILSQTYQNIEILLIDDASADRCGTICDAYADKDVRIRVFHNKIKAQPFTAGAFSLLFSFLFPLAAVYAIL